MEEGERIAAPTVKVREKAILDRVGTSNIIIITSNIDNSNIIFSAV